MKNFKDIPFRKRDKVNALFFGSKERNGIITAIDGHMITIKINGRNEEEKDCEWSTAKCMVDHGWK